MSSFVRDVVELIDDFSATSESATDTDARTHETETEMCNPMDSPAYRRTSGAVRRKAVGR